VVQCCATSTDRSSCNNGAGFRNTALSCRADRGDFVVYWRDESAQVEERFAPKTLERSANLHLLRRFSSMVPRCGCTPNLHGSTFPALVLPTSFRPTHGADRNVAPHWSLVDRASRWRSFCPARQIIGWNELWSENGWQKNGGQKNGVVKDGGGCPGALEQAIVAGARPSPGASIRPPMSDRFR